MVYSKNKVKVYVKYQAPAWEETGECIYAKEYNSRGVAKFYVILENGNADVMSAIDFNTMIEFLNLKEVEYYTEEEFMKFGKDIARKDMDLSDLA